MTPHQIAGHVIITGTITDETEKALRIKIDDVDGTPWLENQKSFWIPISQTHSHFESHNQGEDWIQITNWLADKIGLI